MKQQTSNTPGKYTYTNREDSVWRVPDSLADNIFNYISNQHCLMNREYLSMPYSLADDILTTY